MAYTSVDSKEAQAFLWGVNGCFRAFLKTNRSWCLGMLDNWRIPREIYIDQLFLDPFNLRSEQLVNQHLQRSPSFNLIYRKPESSAESLQMPATLALALKVAKQNRKSKLDTIEIRDDTLLRHLYFKDTDTEEECPELLSSLRQMLFAADFKRFSVQRVNMREEELSRFNGAFKSLSELELNLYL
jgi:hypothetical protein